MRYRAGLVAMVIGAGVACTPPPGKQWLKPGPYTSAEFNRDVTVCTKDGVLDERCMEGRGWVAVNPERPAPVKARKDVPVQTLPPGRY